MVEAKRYQYLHGCTEHMAGGGRWGWFSMVTVFFTWSWLMSSYIWSTVRGCRSCRGKSDITPFHHYNHLGWSSFAFMRWRKLQKGFSTKDIVAFSMPWVWDCIILVLCNDVDICWKNPMKRSTCLWTLRKESLIITISIDIFLVNADCQIVTLSGRVPVSTVSQTLLGLVLSAELASGSLPRQTR